MRRRRRAPGTQLARAGRRTCILTVDTPVPLVRFRASVLDGDPSGQVEADRGGPLPQISALREQVEISGADLIAVSVVPDHDTAITFLPVRRADSMPAMIGGLVLVAAAIGWTVYEFLGF